LVGSSVTIGPNEEVHNAVAVGGSVDVQGRVRHDTVAIGGDVHVHPGAEVGHDAVALGGAVVVEPGATVRGSRVSMGAAEVARRVAGIGGAVRSAHRSFFWRAGSEILWFVVYFV